MRIRFPQGQTPYQPSQSQKGEKPELQLKSPIPRRSSKNSLSCKMIIQSPVKISFYHCTEYLFWFTKIWLTFNFLRTHWFSSPINQWLTEIRQLTLYSWQKCAYNMSLSGSTGISIGGSGPLSNCGSRRIFFSLAQYLSKVKGSGAEETHQETLICVALSHPEIVEENLWLGTHTDS